MDDEVAQVDADLELPPRVGVDAARPIGYGNPPSQKGRMGKGVGRPTFRKFLRFMESIPTQYTGPKFNREGALMIGPLVLVDESGKALSRADALMETTFRIAIGNPDKPPTSTQMQAIELIYAYLWGRPRQAMEVSGPDGGPMETNNFDPAALTSEAQIQRIRQLRAVVEAAEVTAAVGKPKPDVTGTPDGK